MIKVKLKPGKWAAKLVFEQKSEFGNSPNLEGTHFLPRVASAIVFLHPFSDGNGRIHRFLIHRILAHREARLATRTWHPTPSSVRNISEIARDSVLSEDARSS
jgi:hypothetical protein